MQVAMSEADRSAETPDAEPPAALRQRGLAWLGALPLAWRIGGAVLIVVVLGVSLAWLQRETIARNLVGNWLAEQGIAARYEIESIGVERQVIRNLVFGDPTRPDARIDRLVVDLHAGLGGVGIAAAELSGVRAFGRLGDDGKVHFGSLDPLIYTDSEAPFELPDMRLRIEDARLRIDSRYGTIGIKAEGDGHLRDGFSVSVAAVAETVQGAGCQIARPTLFGTMRIVARRPEFSGPLRFAGLDCAGQHLATGRGAAMLTAKAGAGLDRIEGRIAPEIDAPRFATLRAAGLAGALDYAWRAGGTKGSTLTAALRLRLAQPALPGAAFAAATLDARIGGDALGSAHPAWQARGVLDGHAFALGKDQWRDLEAGVGTMAELPPGPLAHQMLGAARRDLKGADARIRFSAASTSPNGAAANPASGWRIALPEVALTGAGGSALAGFAGEVVLLGDAAPRVRGRLTTDGRGWPQLAATIAPTASGHRVQLALQRYAAPGAALALANGDIAIDQDGGLRFSADATLSGPLPGGAVEQLAVPLQGRWSAAGGLALFDRCTTLRFAAFQLSSLSARDQAPALCPVRGQPIVRQGAAGWQIAARLDQGRFAGRLGETPLRIASGGVDFAFPGRIGLDDLDVLIGRADAGTHIRAERLEAALGKAIVGRFEGAEAYLDAVPLEMVRGNGAWRFADGVLSLDADAWFLRDRARPARFQPLVTHDARLSLTDGTIRAGGHLSEPQTDRLILAVDIAHDLGSTRGHADLDVPGVRFDQSLQPEMVTSLALGVVANVRGSLAGKGRIDWTSDGVTSSGRFTTESLDLAAAFGPVTGLAGTITFTDLLGMVTAPDQVATIQEVNPGVPAYQGEVHYRLLPNFRMQVDHGEWPFAGGRLVLEPTILALTEDVPRYLTFRVERIDAAEFLSRFDFENINATGHFSGVLPMVFDQDGGHIRDGRLEVIEDGGTLAYVGQLSYEDMGAMTNYAFNALKSLRYRNLVIELDGELDGEVITQVRFAGLQQGEGASRNFLTKQLEKLPIQFNVTIRAPFLQLLNAARSLYDTQYLPDPATLGILPGQAANPTGRGLAPPTPAEPGVQPLDSEKQR